jgi:hypothetical protein
MKCEWGDSSSGDFRRRKIKEQIDLRKTCQEKVSRSITQKCEKKDRLA